MALPQSYKLCDLRPAYGQIFSQWLEDYDFWGHCDNDMIFGDIRRFITDDILSGHDKVLTRGHFTLYRNTPEVNSRFREMPNWREVMASPRNFCFDEWPGVSSFWRDHYADRQYDKILFDDICYLKHHFVTVHKRELDKGRRHFAYLYDSGRLFRLFEENGEVGKEETMYVHFQKRRLSVETGVSDRFLIVPNRIVPFHDQSILLSCAKNALTGCSTRNI